MAEGAAAEVEVLEEEIIKIKITPDQTQVHQDGPHPDMQMGLLLIVASTIIPTDEGHFIVPIL